MVRGVFAAQLHDNVRPDRYIDRDDAHERAGVGKTHVLALQRADGCNIVGGHLQGGVLGIFPFLVQAAVRTSIERYQVER